MINKTKQYYLDRMGIQCWVSKQNIAASENSVSSSSSLSALEEKPLTPLTWEALEARVAACIACSLHKTRTQTVFGVGNHHAELMIIGEAPGANEDRLGQPFVGRAGQLLDAMLNAIGLTREKIYIANILKCRPPNNRDPNPEEVAQCTPFLQRQIALIQPKLILALGRIAAHHLLKSTASLSSLRGRQLSYGENNIPLLVSYHPAYLLRSPRDKAKAYQDLQTVRQFIILNSVAPRPTQSDGDIQGERW